MTNEQLEKENKILKKIVDNYEDLQAMNRDYERFKIDLIREHESNRKYQRQKIQLESEIGSLGTNLHRVRRDCEFEDDFSKKGKFN